MKRLSGPRCVGLVLVMVTLFFLGGCGYKNDPVPPDKIVPKAINDLAYTIDEKGVRLTWSYPIETILGTDIVAVDSFELYRAVVPLKDYCQNCPIPFSDPIEVAGGATSDEERRKANYETTLLRSGHRYFFKVRSRTSWWASSGDSNIVSFIWHTPVKAIGSLQAKGGDSSVSLSWQPASTLIDGRTVEDPVRYQVLRSLGGKGFEKVGEPVAGTSFVDRQAKTGKKYFYKIQSLLVLGADVVAGGVSDSVSGMAVDAVPPAPVTGVTAVRTSKGIKLFWDQSDESDVKSYKIYRRTAAEDMPKMIGEVQAVYTIFVDTSAAEDVSYYYSVTAVDSSERGNESDKSREATVRH